MLNIPQWWVSRRDPPVCFPAGPWPWLMRHWHSLTVSDPGGEFSEYNDYAATNIMKTFVHLQFNMKKMQCNVCSHHQLFLISNNSPLYWLRHRPAHSGHGRGKSSSHRSLTEINFHFWAPWEETMAKYDMLQECLIIVMMMIVIVMMMTCCRSVGTASAGTHVLDSGSAAPTLFVSQWIIYPRVNVQMASR